MSSHLCVLEMNGDFAGRLLVSVCFHFERIFCSLLFVYEYGSGRLASVGWP